MIKPMEAGIATLISISPDFSRVSSDFRFWFSTFFSDKIGNATVVTAMVPLANMFGYINNLRSMSQGRAQYSMFFDHYDKVPQNVQDEVTKKTG